jgi:hypothetical protein
MFCTIPRGFKWFLQPRRLKCCFPWSRRRCACRSIYGLKSERWRNMRSMLSLHERPVVTSRERTESYMVCLVNPEDCHDSSFSYFHWISVALLSLDIYCIQLPVVVTSHLSDKNQQQDGKNMGASYKVTRTSSRSNGKEGFASCN